jgi:ATP-dependent Clp protease protease subunit
MPKRHAFSRNRGFNRPSGISHRMRLRASMEEALEEEDEELSGPAYNVFVEDGLIAVYLSRGIVEAHHYDPLCHLLRQASEDDEVMIYINSEGGDMFGGMSIISAMRDCPAVVKTILGPTAMSMAAMIFLCGDEFEVPDSAYLMLHNFSGGGNEGKGNEILAEMLSSVAWFATVIREICRGFLSDAEIELMLSTGKDFWLQADEIRERLAGLELAHAEMEAEGAVEE